MHGRYTEVHCGAQSLADQCPRLGQVLWPLPGSAAGYSRRQRFTEVPAGRVQTQWLGPAKSHVKVGGQRPSAIGLRRGTVLQAGVDSWTLVYQQCAANTFQGDGVRALAVELKDVCGLRTLGRSKLILDNGSNIERMYLSTGRFVNASADPLRQMCQIVRPARDASTLENAHRYGHVRLGCCQSALHFREGSRRDRASKTGDKCRNTPASA
jgi:hypothetical protein